MNVNIARAGFDMDKGPTAIQIPGDVMVIERAFYQHFVVGGHRTRSR